MIKNAQYFSNIIEIDAELLSYYFTQNILDQLEQKPEFAKDPDFATKLAIAKMEYSTLERNFTKEVESSLKIVNVSNQGHKAIFELASSYSKQLFAEDNHDGSRTPPEYSQKVISMLDALINGRDGQQVINFSRHDLYTLKYRIFEGTSSHEILRHLDDPFMQYLAKLEDQFEFVGQYKYEQYVSRIKKYVAEPLSQFVKKYNLPHTEGDYASMLDAYFENFHEISIQNLLSGKEVSSFVGIDIYLSLKFDDLKPQIDAIRDREIYKTRVPMDLLYERAENSVDTQTYSIATSVLPNFAEACREQKSKNMFGKYLAALGIPSEEYEQYTYTQAYEVLQKTAPKFIMQHILDDNISEYKKDLYKFCLTYGDVSLERLHKELFTHPILGLKLRTMQKNKFEELPDVLKLLHFNGRPIKYILDPNKKKREEQSLS